MVKSNALERGQNMQDRSDAVLIIATWTLSTQKECSRNNARATKSVWRLFPESVRHLFYLASERAQPLSDPITGASDSLKIARSGLNRNKFPEGIQKRLLLPLNRPRIAAETISNAATIAHEARAHRIGVPCTAPTT